MNISVLVKLVPDTQAVLKIAGDRRSLITNDLNMVLNVYDEYAIEEALKTREAEGGTVTVVSLGDDGAVKALRTALAMGADEALHIKCRSGLDILGTAKAIAEAIADRGFDLIFAGKQAVDDDCGAIGVMVAELLGLPHVAATQKMEINERVLRAERAIEGGVEVFEANLPVLITTEKGLNEPRYASLKGIMMAKRKKIEEVESALFDARAEIVGLAYPPIRPPGRIVGEGVDAVPELVRLLKEEAKVL